jgi:hypothetical protein
VHATEDATPSTLVVVDVGQVLDDLAALDHEELVELVWARTPSGARRSAA